MPYWVLLGHLRSPRNVLLLQMLLLINLAILHEMARSSKSYQIVLFVLGCYIYHSSDNCTFLYQSMGWFHDLLQLAELPCRLRRQVDHLLFSNLDCVGPSAIYRMSLSILCLFGLMLVVTLTRSRCAMIMNEGLFCIKYLLVLGLFIGFLWINNQVFINFSDVSIYLSIIFMVIQVTILLLSQLSSSICSILQG